MSPHQDKKINLANTILILNLKRAKKLGTRNKLKVELPYQFSNLIDQNIHHLHLYCYTQCKVMLLTHFKMYKILPIQCAVYYNHKNVPM